MIRKYQNKDFYEINKITEEFWKDEFKMSEELQKFIYDFLVKYYLYDNNITYVYECDNEIVAFLLAHLINENNDARNYFYNNIVFLNDNDKILAQNYLEYLEYNYKMVKEVMPEKSVYLGLIASKKRGAGKELINKLLAHSKKYNLGDIYLWTDETCNYLYYEKIGFVLRKSYDINFFNKKIRTFIYSISNSLSMN